MSNHPSTEAMAAAQVIQAVEAMTAAVQRADLPAVLAAYGAGAQVAFEPGLPVAGEPALAEGFAAFFAVQPVFSYAGHEVMAVGDLALHIAPWTMRGTAPDGTALSQRGLSVAVLRRDDTGVWRIVLDNPYGDRLLAAG